MTRDIVEHILQMKFDNQQFESNVKTTLNSLDNLKESLSFNGSESKGLAMLESNVAAISDRFSALGIVAATVLQRIADKAVDIGAKILKSLTIEGAMDGFREYELKLDSIQTIMAGTGESLGTVSRYLDELNTYADKTIYSFSDMTSSIAKFTNAGVGLEDAVRAIQGVSNEAALSGANAAQASHAMYNFAQALSSGAVKLIDWKSIETANMATKEFKEQLIATALELGTVVRDGDKYVSTTTDLKGSVSDAFDAVQGFNDSLSAQWMTTDVLVKTLGIYADETTDLGKRAFAAAQDVKTFTQLVDTLKEAVGSGWAQSFEIIVGNFDEAKELWTAVNNELSAIVDKQSKMRNDLLQGWKDAGGRSELIGGLRNIWRAVVSYITPIKEAFQDIFPAVGPLRLAGLSEQFKIFTSHLKLGDEAGANLKNTFSGLFSILDAGKQAFEAIFRVVAPVAPHLTNLADALLHVTGKIGEYVTQIVKSARENDVFYNALNRVAEVFKMGFGGVEKALGVIKPYLPTVEDFSNLLGWLAEKVEPLANLFDSAKESISGFFSSFRRNGEKDSVGLFGKILEISGQAMQAARQAMSFLGGVFQKIGTVFSDIFTGLDFARVAEFLNTFMTVGIGAGIIEFIHSLSKITSGAGSFVKSLTGILDGVTGSLEALQLKVKAEALMPVAGAVAILTASLIALSAVDPEKLSSSLSALTTMLIQLGAFMAVFVKIVNGIDGSGAGNETQSIGDKIKNMVTGLLGIGGGGNDDKLTSAAKALMMISGAVVILSTAMVLLSGLSWEEIAKGLVSVAGLMAALTASAMFLSKSEGKLIKGASGLVLFAAAMDILAGAVAKMAALNWEQLAVGLTGTGGLILELAAFLKLADFDGIGLMKGLGLIALAESLKIMASAVQSMGSIDFNVITKGIIGIGSVLLEVGLFSMMMEGVGNLAGIGAGMAVIAASMLIFSNAISAMGSLDMEVIAKGLMTMGTALLLIGAATAMMPATMPLIGTGLVIFAEGLLIVNNALQQIGQMSWDELTKGL